MTTVNHNKYIQEKALDVLKFFDFFCRKHDLKYSLGYGTLLGAVRHKGFIPWDDDIDVLMPRKDFDLFIELMKHEDSKYKILDIYNEQNFYAGTILKLYDSSTELHEFPDKYNLKYGIFIDIFPVDGVDVLNKEDNWHYFQKKMKKLHFFKATFFKKHDIRRYFKNIISIFAKSNIVEMKKFFAKVPFDSSDMVIVYPYERDMNKAMFPRRYFDNLVEIDFEDTSFLAFAASGEYLANYYGDYMTLPPVEQRETKHDFTVYIK